jgi:hypothetical protein
MGARKKRRLVEECERERRRAVLWSEGNSTRGSRLVCWRGLCGLGLIQRVVTRGLSGVGVWSHTFPSFVCSCVCRNASASAGSSTKTSSPGCLERVSGSSLFFPRTCPTLKLNRFNSMAHRVSFPRSSWILSSQVRAELSV